MTSLFCGRSSFIFAGGAILCLLVLALAGAATIWGEPKTAQLKWGEETTIDGYEVRAEEFLIDARGEVSVSLNISDNNNLSDKNHIFLSAWNGTDGRSWSLKDKLRIEVGRILGESIDENDFAADIELQIPSTPEISLALNPDSKSYEGGDEINLDFAASNTLPEDIENLRITFDSNQDLIRKELRGLVKWPEEGQLRRRSTWEDSISLNAPHLPRTEDVEISATAEYTDPAGKAYRIQAGIPIRIYGPLHLTKLVYDNNMSVGSLNTVSLILRYKPYSAIRIDPPVDSSGPNFLMTTPSYKEGASSCDGAFCYRTYSYSIRAMRPGSHNLPAARVSYTLGNMTYYESSESPKVYVFGPYIDAYGSVSPDKNDSGNRNASITLKNTGNKNAYDLVLEYDAPQRNGLARGEPAAPRLEPNKNKTVIIPLKCQKGGECDIPSLRIEYRYFDINPLNKTFQSGSVGVRFGNQAPFSPPVPERKETATVGHEGIAQGNIENILNGFINNILNIKIRF